MTFLWRAIDPASPEGRSAQWALEAYSKPNKIDWLMLRLGMMPFTWPANEPPEYHQWDCEALSEMLTHTAP